MKLIFLLAVTCLALHNGEGAPMTAVYKFLRCNPEGGKANCVTQQTPEMPWSPDLPSKLPASDAKYLEAEPVEGESPSREEEEEEEVVEEETPMRSEDGESPLFVEEGSGYEGSATDYMSFADEPTGAESETGSGDSWTESAQPQGGNKRRSSSGGFPGGEAKPTEQDLEEDHLLKM
ncbi:serglycin [Fundulus heteroclitus]|uniref:serglycin n=1 Tax=Fundulus heteroclitus TaxID=8078 RepID=UPI00165ADEE2|nr:serglycin [Fundulus heteroclitus]